MIPTIKWLAEKKCACLIDQTKLPHSLEFLEISSYHEMARMIRDMHIRGAPAIGVAAAFGMVLAAQEFENHPFDEFKTAMEKAATTLAQTRPTAVNLFWAINLMKKLAFASQPQILDPHHIVTLMQKEAQKMWQADIDTNLAIGRFGAAVLSDGDTVLTHCNAGSLATVLYGTALAPIRWAVEKEQKQIKVIADETRPRLQGARLTAWELHYDHIPVQIEPDNTAGLMMRMGHIQKIIVGADRIVRDAVFNKIGTYMLAITSNYHHIPFYVAAPRSTLSMQETEKDVIIEQRSGEFEVSQVLGLIPQGIAPKEVPCINYAFDATPMELITGIITEDGVFSPSELLKKYAPEE